MTEFMNDFLYNRAVGWEGADEAPNWSRLSPRSHQGYLQSLGPSAVLEKEKMQISQNCMESKDAYGWDLSLG